MDYPAIQDSVRLRGIQAFAGYRDTLDSVERRELADSQGTLETQPNSQATRDSQARVVILVSVGCLVTQGSLDRA